MYSLTVTPLRFVCEALTPIRLARYEAGSHLRGSLGRVMRRAYCPEASLAKVPQPSQGSDGHTATCPVCWLLAANEHPGEERRGYALRPPTQTWQVSSQPARGEAESNENLPGLYALGERFEFGLTLFGSTLRFLPYFILAVPEIGRQGVGTGRGRFALRQVWADDPLGGRSEVVLAEGESLVHVPQPAIDEARVSEAAERLARAIEPAGRLRLRFLTPMRLIEAGVLLKSPDFGVLFARLLHRLDNLSQQFANGEERGEADRVALQAAADRVRLISAETEWIDVWSGSTRTGDRTPMGGFVGRATYAAPIETWIPLLPWLVWGQIAQVGKDTVKGNGVYQIEMAA